jgi:YVTN family beta-propeller protein
MRTCLSALVMLTSTLSAFAGQAPGAAEQPDIAVSERDRFYTSDQFSNTVSVINPASNKLLGVIRLGDPTPGNLSPLYRGQLLVHGMGFSPDHRTLLAISIGSNSVSFIDTASNSIKHVTYVGRAPHEAFFTPDGKEVWVSVRGENYIASRSTQWAGDDDLFARRHLWLCLLQLYAGDSCYSHGQQTDCRPGEAGKSILPRHCRYTGRETGLADAQGYWQGNGLQRAAAIRSDKGA